MVVWARRVAPFDQYSTMCIPVSPRVVVIA